MSNLEMKLGFMLFIFPVGITGGLVTLRLEKFRGIELLFSLGSALAGG